MIGADEYTNAENVASIEGESRNARKSIVTKQVVNARVISVVRRVAYNAIIAA
jgi:hypothetical protein